MTVAIARVHNRKEIEATVRKAIGLLGFKPKRNVFIKPNVSAPHEAKTGVITDPEVVRAVIRVLKAEGAREIIIGEGAVIGEDSWKCFEATGLKRVAEEEGATLIDLNDCERVGVKWKFGRISMPSILVRSDMSYINMPKIKTHVQTTVSLSLKNQKGLLLPEDKKRFHILGLHEPIAELANITKPDLVVADGVIGLEGDGPGTMGKPRYLGVIVVGDNQVEVDSTCCRIIGINPAEVLHIRLAHELGLGNIDTKPIGSNIEDVKVEFLKPKECYYKFFNIYFWASPSACSGCTSAMSEAKKVIWKMPSRLLKCLFHGFFGRIDIIAGGSVKIPVNHRRIICIGNCTRKMAEKNGFTLVRGCPPDPREIVEAL